MCLENEFPNLADSHLRSALEFITDLSISSQSNARNEWGRQLKVDVKSEENSHDLSATSGK